MGKKGGSSWLTAVKRAFRSPTKDITQEKDRNCRRKEDHNPNPNPNPPSEDQDDEKKREKRRWLFKKGSRTTQSEKAPNSNAAEIADQRHAIAVAVATAAAAEAATAATKAAVEVARLTRATPTYTNPREIYAAIVIQTSFRGYLARRALRALKGLVKLQALVRGHNVRKQAKMTLKCMQALVRVQAQVLDQRLRLSHEGFDKRSISHSRAGSSVAEDWGDERERLHSIEEVKAMLLSRKEAAALRRERNLSQAFSHQTWRSDRSSIGGGAEREEMEEKPRMWLDRWKKASKEWDSSSVVSPSPVLRGRASTDHRHSIKTVEIDTTTFRRSTSTTPNQRPSSPLHTRVHHHHPSTPSPTRVRPASPSSHVSQTPSLRSNYCYTPSRNRGPSTVPSYMAATESARAKARAHSAPRQRPPSTPERDLVGAGLGLGLGPKKRLSFPNYPDPCGGGVMGYGLRSPSFKSVVEQQSMYSSCCTESLGAGEISPSSTTDLRRWFR